MNNDVQSRRPDFSIRPSTCEQDSLTHVLERARETLETVSVMTKERSLSVQASALDLESADAALSDSERLLSGQMADFRDTASAEASALAAALIQVKAVRTAIKDAELVRRSAALKDVRAALGRLRSVRSSQALIERAPAEIGGLGYHRGMVSLLSGSTWIARSAFAPDEPGLAATLVQLGNASPGRLGRDLPETESVRYQTPVLVKDALNHPRVHRELITLAKTRDYVAAPLIAHGNVVALLHADREDQPGTISAFDCDLLGMFAEGLGFAFEHTLLMEQLGRLRSSLEDEAQSVTDLVDGFIDSDAMTEESQNEAVPIYTMEGPLSCLTRRELEVLHHLAAGESNTQIASRLFVSVGTVKTHVKHVLRKLRAANRADAASRYYRLIQATRPR